MKDQPGKKEEGTWRGMLAGVAAILLVFLGLGAFYFVIGAFIRYPIWYYRTPANERRFDDFLQWSYADANPTGWGERVLNLVIAVGALALLFVVLPFWLSSWGLIHWKKTGVAKGIFLFLIFPVVTFRSKWGDAWGRWAGDEPSKKVTGQPNADGDASGDRSRRTALRQDNAWVADAARVLLPIALEMLTAKPRIRRGRKAPPSKSGTVGERGDTETEGRGEGPRTMSACKPFQIEVAGDLAEVFRKVKGLADEAGVKFEGSVASGSFTGKGIEGEYSSNGNMVMITIWKKPFIYPCSLIEARIRAFFT